MQLPRPAGPGGGNFSNAASLNLLAAEVLPPEADEPNFDWRATVNSAFRRQMGATMRQVLRLVGLWVRGYGVELACLGAFAILRCKMHPPAAAPEVVLSIWGAKHAQSGKHAQRAHSLQEFHRQDAPRCARSGRRARQPHAAGLAGRGQRHLAAAAQQAAAAGGDGLGSCGL